MKPCWYIDPLGEKCHIEGILVSVIEEMVLAETAKHKDGFLTNIEEEDNGIQALQISISEREALLTKQKKALALVNDAYEMVITVVKNGWKESGKENLKLAKQPMKSMS
jgi:hypothetical protein